MPKILVADDNANIQKMVVLAFAEHGIDVVTVGNGEAAVRRLPDLNPDLILADIFMPVRNGYEVCEYVKKDQRFSHIPVILLVGAFDPLDEKEARRVGADGVLKKPFVPPDPLIAMVISALEKNPKLAAELAKATEPKEVLPPEPMPHLEIPSRPAPKPLPEFPEPSADEAAIIYGFGKGTRAMDDEHIGSAGGHKPPIADTEDETDEDEFDEASTSSNWRRDAMDFEIPADSANKPAFSSTEDLDPVMFPSEDEYPPKRIRAPKFQAEVEPVSKDDVPVFLETETTTPVFVDPPAEPVPAVQVASEAEPEIQEASAPEQEPIPEAISEAIPEPAMPNTMPEPISDASEPPKAPHWMDALSTFESRQTGGAWVTALSEQPAESAATESHADLVVEQSHSEESGNSLNPSPATIASVEAHAEAITEAIVEDSVPPALVSSMNNEEPSSEEPPIESEPASRAPEESWFAPAPPVFERIYDPVSAPVAVAPAAPDQGLEVDRSGDESSLAFKDPALVEPPAVRVTPEPLLIDDNERRGPSDYGTHSQPIAPPHSFFVPASVDPVVEEVSVHDEVLEPSLEDSPNEDSERIPTVPPPNREALAEIPFLTPPPDFHPETHEAPASTETVDEVVRRVLEKLEPRLHDLLSQNVLRPLVENLLQSEGVKKEK